LYHKRFGIFTRSGRIIQPTELTEMVYSDQRSSKTRIIGSKRKENETGKYYDLYVLGISREPQSNPTSLLLILMPFHSVANLKKWICQD